MAHLRMLLTVASSLTKPWVSLSAVHCVERTGHKAGLHAAGN